MDDSDSGRIRGEATRWFVALHDDPADPAPRAAFEQWRAADPRHGEHYARVQRLWGAAGHLPGVHPFPAPAIDRRRMLRGGMAAAAGIAATIGAGRLALGAHPFADHRTDTGERRTVALADGSTADLSSATALDVDFGPDARRITLLAGEAHFTVPPDAARPFRVSAAGGTVTALGTAFAVAHAGGGARIDVTDHVVRVDHAAASVRVDAGRSVAFADGRIAAPEPSDANRLAWRHGRLAFAARPLGEVVAELNRWTSGEVMILDDALARRPVTLMIRAADAAAGIDWLAAVVPMRVMRITDLLTLVRAA